jgi:hypothetical protein
VLRGPLARSLPAAATALACLVCAAPAGATRTEAARAPAYNPELTSSGVAFLSPVGHVTRVVHAVPGATPTKLVEYPNRSADPDCCTANSEVLLAAGDGVVASAQWVQIYAKALLAEDTFQLDAGPAGGPFSTRFECSELRGLAIDGSRLAYSGDNCSEKDNGGDRIVIRDLAAAGSPVVGSIPQTGKALGLQLAGQHVAIYGLAMNTGEMRVRDIGADSDAYSVIGDVIGASLQADGKLAVATDSSGAGGCRVDWYSKAEPVAHKIDVCPIGDVKLVGDRIALVRESGSGAVLDIIDLSGALVRTVARFGAADMLSGFDFDGSRVAYAVSGCTQAGDTVYIDDLTGETTPADSTKCPVSISKSNVRAGSSGLVRVGFKCSAGCQGYFTIQRGGKSIVKDVRLINQKPGSGKAIVRLKPSALKQLRSAGSLTVQARLQAGQRSGQPRTYKRSFRLLAP